jgi:hypothetical protein
MLRVCAHVNVTKLAERLPLTPRRLRSSSSLRDYDGIAPLPAPGKQSPICDGLDPNAAGYFLMVPLAQQGISEALQAAAKAQ